MKNLTLENLAAACNGRYVGPEEKRTVCVTAITTDSRKVTEGCLFVAIRGATEAARPLSQGVLKEGCNADFVCVSLDSITRPYTDPGLDPLAMLVQRGTRASVRMTFVNGEQTWGVDEAFRDKEKAAEERICASIRKLRAADPGKRDNEPLLSRVHDFYAASLRK